MKILVITVAGLSSRFSESVGRECLKCIYYEEDPRSTLLYKMVAQAEMFDKIVIVGGFLFDRLKEYIDEHFVEIKEKLILVYNEHYLDYGSGYSLYLGLKAIQDMEYSEVVFAEGDLYVEQSAFKKLCDLNKDALSRNKEPIFASKAVAFYYDITRGIHYIYDTQHSQLFINEPFLGIFNSGQIWKFCRKQRLEEIVNQLSEDEQKGTNLILIQRYFEDLRDNEYEVMEFDIWINCNTITDYKKMLGE